MTENNYIMYLVKSYATIVLNDRKPVSNFLHIGINARRCGASHWPVSVRLSVSLMYCIEMVKDVIVLLFSA